MSYMFSSSIFKGGDEVEVIAIAVGENQEVGFDCSLSTPLEISSRLKLLKKCLRKKGYKEDNQFFIKTKMSGFLWIISIGSVETENIK